MTAKNKDNSGQSDRPRRGNNREHDGLRCVRVLHVITQLELGGAQQNTLYTLKYLNSREDTEKINRQLDSHRYKTFLASNTEGLLRAEAEKIPGLKTFFLPELRREINPVLDLIALAKLYRICKSEKIDIIHTHSSKAGILGRWAGWLAAVPVIIHTVHGWGFNDYQSRIVKKTFIFLEKVSALITHKLIVVAAANRDKGLFCGIGRPEQYAVIHSGIKIEKFSKIAVNIDIAGEVKKAEERNKEAEKKEERRKEQKRELGLVVDEPVVGMIACFKPQKAPLDFIRVAAEVLKQLPRTQFLLVGDGVLRPEIEALIDELDLEARTKDKGNNGIKDKIILTGWRDDMPGIIRTFDILALTSLWEGLPRVFPEAMASGLPIVATNVDGAAEAVKDGRTGFLVKPHDIQDIARKIILLLENKSLAQNMGAEGQRLVYPDFDIDVMVERITALYEELVRERCPYFFCFI